jgi:hypothetical protein
VEGINTFSTIIPSRKIRCFQKVQKDQERTRINVRILEKTRQTKIKEKIQRNNYGKNA